jgi:hypothetical protein
MLHLLKKSRTGLFASRSLSGHLVRGAVAFALLYFAIGQQHAHPLYAVAAGLAALVAMRGCPVCWTIGLLETVQQRIARTSAMAHAGDRTRERS